MRNFKAGWERFAADDANLTIAKDESAERP
jgi:hypothetical protein